jgi:integrase
VTFQKHILPIIVVRRACGDFNRACGDFRQLDIAKMIFGPFGGVAVLFLEADTVGRIIEANAEYPVVAIHSGPFLSAMFGWAVEENHLKANPARDVRRVRYVSNGFHTWTVAEVCQFANRHPIGTRPYLAMCLLLFTGMRTGDMIRLGPQHARGDCIAFVPRKTRHVRGDISEKPFLQPLADAIKAGSIGKISFLETQYGRRFSDKGIGNATGDAGVPRRRVARGSCCFAEGLRYKLPRCSSTPLGSLAIRQP